MYLFLFYVPEDKSVHLWWYQTKRDSESRKIFVDLCAKLYNLHSRTLILSRSSTSKNRRNDSLMYNHGIIVNPARDVTRCTTKRSLGLKFWSPKTDRLCQSRLKSFLDPAGKRPLLEETIAIQRNADVLSAQNPAIRAPRSNSVAVPQNDLSPRPRGKKNAQPQRIAHLDVKIDQR